ncbi:MAG: methyl-accepting chemotaxis protein, partial [Gallionella sp.]
KVEAGSKQVDQAGETMQEIVSAVKRVTDIMSEIAAASNEQSAGIEQVNQAIIQMDEVTQQNAALVEQAAAAAESMQEQAGSLMDAVSIFKLATAQESRRPAAAPIATPAVTHRVPPPPRKERKLVEAKEDADGDWKEF